jgi:hypothetical protein
MEQDAEKFAFPPVFGKAVVELTGIDEESLPCMDRGHLAVDIVIHLPGEHSDELHIVVPVAQGRVLRILGEAVFFDKDKISGITIGDVFRTVFVQVKDHRRQPPSIWCNKKYCYRNIGYIGRKQIIFTI